MIESLFSLFIQIADSKYLLLIHNKREYTIKSIFILQSIYCRAILHILNIQLNLNKNVLNMVSTSCVVYSTEQDNNIKLQ